MKSPLELGREVDGLYLLNSSSYKTTDTSLVPRIFLSSLVSVNTVSVNKSHSLSRNRLEYLPFN